MARTVPFQRVEERFPRIPEPVQAGRNVLLDGEHGRNEQKIAEKMRCTAIYDASRTSIDTLLTFFGYFLLKFEDF